MRIVHLLHNGIYIEFPIKLHENHLYWFSSLSNLRFGTNFSTHRIRNHWAVNYYVLFVININKTKNSLWHHIWINLFFWQNFLDSGISFSILAAPRAPAARSYFLKIDWKKIWLLPSFSRTRYCTRLRDQIWRDWTDNYRKEVS